LLLLIAVHIDLSVIAVIGIILLIGIVKRNGIMVVEVERSEGLTSEKSIYQACVLRFRPILTTSWLLETPFTRPPLQVTPTYRKLHDMVVPVLPRAQ